jgi:hypothetical protein
MNIELRTEEDKVLGVNVTGTTVFNTDDYTELEGKTVDEIKQMDLKELLELETSDGTCLVNTMRYGTFVDEDDKELDVNDLDGCETEIFKYQLQP